MIEIQLSLSFVLSFLLVLYGTPIIRKVAFRYNLLDIPDDRLKKHKEPVPYMGGVIVYFAVIAPVSLFPVFRFSQELLGILFASSILLIVGLFDDFKAINPGTKFLFQVVATYILIKSGIRINLSFLAPWLNVSLTFLWILSIINAFNIIDILDGFSSSIGAVSCLTLFVISLYNEKTMISILTLSLAAALFGFLKFNWEPAKIYLGDAGSMVLGIIIGSLTIIGDYSEYNNLAFISGAMILAIPIFDMIYVIILRLLQGKSPFFGSPDHFALRLKKKYNLTVARTVSIILIMQLILSGIVILNFYTNETVTLISTAAVVLFFIVFGVVLARVKMV
ncbi:MAG: undecaprenyl/decaprenyl-phosphate alpha-N-acetylglucosaminyl 1-phosphate transferase [Acidobacteria bacterium]|jgi:UDP-GlcNAc:undecaprenyl-phosphate GlcNAc-1-phosphate transferase|nr:undecaprenyl/decaprenyl-phosphate alpha-N-acetylglucosaminyl 1-phosphate transferase [Acidobacteriota bacterium]